MTIVGFLKSYIKGEIDQAQYWEYFNHIDLEKEVHKNGNAKQN